VHCTAFFLPAERRSGFIAAAVNRTVNRRAPLRAQQIYPDNARSAAVFRRVKEANMEHAFAGLEAGSASKGFRYEQHLPERSLLYQLVEQYYPELADLMAVQGKPLPGNVRREFEGYLKCGRLEHGFLRLRCDTCHAERLLACSCKRRGFCPSCGARRMADDCMDAGGRAKQEPEPKARRYWLTKSCRNSRCAN